MNIEELTKKEVYLHVLFWICYICLPLLEYISRDYMLEQWMTRNSNLPLVLIFAYTLYFYFFKHLPGIKVFRLITFFGVMIVLGVLFSKRIIDFIIFQIDNYSYWIHGLGIASEYVLIGLIFFSAKSLKNSYQIEKLNRLAELNSLRAQISPHFLFNTLNSIYAYVLEGKPKASVLILKLSDHFKYVLHEGQKEKVEVSQDLQQIKDFLYIQELRWENKIIINLEEEVTQPQLLVAPLLLVTFIENAVKYTTKLSGVGHSINIQYCANNNRLTFKCENPYSRTSALESVDNNSGIGLQNTKQRLSLLYPNRHNLHIESSDKIFTVSLTIDL